MKIKKGDDGFVIAAARPRREGRRSILVTRALHRVLVHGLNIIARNHKVNFQGARVSRRCSSPRNRRST